MAANSHLPGPRGNLELLDAFAGAVRDVLTAPEPPVVAIAALLDRWSARPALVTEPGVMLPCAAALARGQLGASLPAQWEHQIALLEVAAKDDRWRVRELVAAGLQRMLSVDWERTCAVLINWAGSPHPLVVRAAAAGVAEPPLLKQASHAEGALLVQRRAVDRLSGIAAVERRSESVRTLRQALGYTISVVVVGTPQAGFGLLDQMARSGDGDLRWIVAENLKKNRLSPWPDRVVQIRAELDAAASRP